MEKPAVNYNKSKGGPLSNDHDNRYLMHVDSQRAAHGHIRSGNFPKTNEKNDVVLSNLTYSFNSDQRGRYHPIVEKSRDKNLNIDADVSGRFERFSANLYSNRNHYMKDDTEEPIQDTFYTNYLNRTRTNMEIPYEVKVNSKELNTFPNKKNGHLSRKLDVVNNKHVKSMDLIKKV